jgi:hypothetical protein
MSSKREGEKLGPQQMGERYLLYAPALWEELEEGSCVGRLDDSVDETGEYVLGGSKG